MARMIELIRASALPSNLMQSAAKGALSVPPREMIEILVYLAVHSKVFGEQARLTLAGWDVSSSKAVASEPGTPMEVLDYLASPHNLRPPLLPGLLENPSVSEEALLELAGSASREVVEAMLKSARVGQLHNVLTSLLSNPNLTGIETTNLRNQLEAAGVLLPHASDEKAAEQVQAPATSEAVTDEVLAQPAPDEPVGTDDVLDEVLLGYLSEHASEISAEQDKPFQPIGGFYEEFIPGAEEPLAETPAVPADVPAAAPTVARKAVLKKTHLAHDEERGSALQKIAKLDVKGRIQLAMKGNKEERSLLIRDGTKVVALAVLDSPKVGDAEVERFASQKNVLEAVLRGIPLKRRFVKHYGIVRNLVFNPRTPLDVSLALIKNLLVHDLRNLSGNKEVSDTVRKLATKMFKQKLDATKKSMD